MLEQFIILQTMALSLTAWADGEVDSKERLLYLKTIGSFGLSKQKMLKLKTYLDTPPSLATLKVLLKKCPLYVTIHVLKNVYLMCQIDGRFDIKEKRLFAALAASAGISSKNRLKDLLKIMHLYYLIYEREEKLLSALKK